MIHRQRTVLRLEEDEEELTSTVAIHAINELVLAHLVQPAITSLAQPIVSPMPRPADHVADFPLLLVGANGGDGADDFMAGDAREGTSAQSNQPPITILFGAMYVPERNA